MTHIITILALLLTIPNLAKATPLLPSFTQDGIPLPLSTPGIGSPFTGPGFYLIALDDMPFGTGDGDYNDLYGTLTINCDDTYHWQELGGLGSYYNRGLVSFAGMVGSSALGWTALFNTPHGRLNSGAAEVFLLKLGSIPCSTCTPIEDDPQSESQVPEPLTYALTGAGLLLLALFRR